MNKLIFIMTFLPQLLLAAFDAQSPLAQTRWELGEEKPLHALEKIESELAKKGKEIFFTGKTTKPDGEETPIQSPAFRCNHCHNSVVEDPNLAVNDPTTRMSYAVANSLAFLPGTTMYGSVNRTTWFNGDYIKKYGPELIEPAHKNFKNALQLCSKECSKGRKLSDWELKVMLNYLWSIQYVLGDLNLSEEEYRILNNSKITNESKLELLDSKYLKFSDANFTEPPKDFEIGYGYNGDPELGKQIYERTCLHCHAPQSGIEAKIPRFTNTFRTFKFLYRLKHSYGVSRIGEFESEMVYMPNYSLERMSDKQLDDLKAFLKKNLESRRFIKFSN